MPSLLSTNVLFALVCHYTCAQHVFAICIASICQYLHFIYPIKHSIQNVLLALRIIFCSNPVPPQAEVHACNQTHCQHSGFHDPDPATRSVENVSRNSKDGQEENQENTSEYRRT